MAKWKQQTKNAVEDRMIKTIDDLAEFEEFRAEVLQKLKKMVKGGKNAAQIREEMQPYLTARQVNIALTAEDHNAALRAIDSLTHQNEGKPTERQEVEHKFGKLKDEELRALVASRLSEREEDNADSERVDH